MNPLVIRIAADLKAFKANMEEMKSQLETNQAAMKRMSNAFDGNKVIGDANAMVKAVSELGGAARLTEAEQRRVNSTVTEALSKYQALGRTAPPALLALRDATAKVVIESVKLLNAFDGSKVISEAKEMSAAIQSIGGASKLTDTEMKRVNGTVTEALAKYKALGREAPPELLALRDATNKVEAATKQVAPPIDSLSTKLKGLAGMFGLAFGGAAVISGIKSLISNTFEYAETIKDTSAKLAISMEATQRWKFAAEQTGASLENVSKSVLKLSQGVAGDEKALKEALSSAGLEFEKLKGMKPEDAFTLVADAIAKIPDPMLQADVALAAFGKSGAELLPALREGFVGLAEGVKVMSDKTINDLDRAKDAWSKLETQVTIATGGMLGKFSLFLEKLAPKMTTMLILMGQFEQAEMWSAFAKGADKAEDSLNKLSAAQQFYVTRAKKAGDSNAEIANGLGVTEQAVTAYLKSLEKVPPVSDRVGTSTAQVTKEMAKLKLTLPGVTDADNARRFFDTLRIGNDQLLLTLPGVTGSVQEFIASVRVGNDVIQDAMQRLPGVADEGASGFVAALRARNDDIRSVGQKWGDALASSFSKALEGLGGVIVGAIQGGGDIGRAAGAHIGQSIGADLATSLLGESTSKLLKGALSFLGPLGALAGSWIGGMVGKLFGNEGRDNAKAFANSFGGFDALREKMLVLGAEGDKLWIALTQNTKGPAQVAQAIKAIEDALASAEEQAKKTGKELEDTFKGPEGARGFPTRAQLQVAAAEAAEAYRYVRDSGLYTADVIEQAWNQWQDAMIASGDETAKRMKELTAEIASLQKAVELETPEYDVNGVLQFGVEEMRNIERLAALEAEKAALNLAQIAKEEHATVEAAKAADLQATKEFEAAKLRALSLDGYLRKLFSGGYEIPITFRLPAGVPGGGSLPGSAPSSFGGASMPSSSGGMAQITILNVNQMDGEVVARKTVTYTAKLLPKELNFTVGSLR